MASVRSCQCHTNGSVSEVCNKETGRCECKQNVAGRQCDECIPNCWWDAELQDCIPCGCSPPGSMSQRCDAEGRCICRPGFVGRHCNLRRQGYERRETRRPVERVPLSAVHQRWGGSSRTGGCPRGAYRPSPGTQTHGISTGGVCVPCHCNSFGSKSFDCDEAGQCRCQPGVSGPKCDRCSRGFFNFQEGGCTPCQCTHVGNNCDTNTGQCICPPNTIGERCDHCAPNHWGHDITTGCKVLDKYNPPDHFLPESYTCFFLLKLPRYSCKQVLEEKLKYAIHFCKSIDTDDYARIALSGEPAADDSSEDSDNEDADSFASDSTQDYLTGH
ncbi:laminin subunit alpha-2-like [Notothenia coriiceps]|uniref:Laminin subunit alpha-2-like n=1 Tax=Notothenia coriiceps TaxID=8208 RepID=A0A6I9MVX8_9TELE|nr:PREDICTED: laminin subunit alpha-2-like [Notothenia coriiceps]